MPDDFTSREYVLRRKGHCKPRVKLDPNDDFVEQTNQHTHSLSKSNCENSKVRMGRKQCPTETENLRRNIRSARNGKNLSPLPINIVEIPVLLMEFQKNNKQRSVLFFGSGAGAADKIIAFGSVQARQVHVQSKNLYGDNTFKVCQRNLPVVHFPRAAPW